VLGKDREYVVGALQMEFDRISSWWGSTGVLINPTRAKMTWFSLNNHAVNFLTPTLNLCMMDVERTNTRKYLNVQCDRSFAFTERVDHVIIKARKGVAAIRVMAVANCEQRHLVLLFQGLVLSVVEYALAIFTVSQTQIQRLEHIQNEAMRILLGCTRNTACRAMRHLLDFPAVKDSISLSRASVYLRVSADTRHSLRSEIGKEKASRLKRGKC
jgi:hypothetical protein